MEISEYFYLLAIGGKENGYGNLKAAGYGGGSFPVSSPQEGDGSGCYFGSGDLLEYGSGSGDNPDSSYEYGCFTGAFAKDFFDQQY